MATMQEREADPKWTHAKKPHWWSIEDHYSADGKWILTYWLWDGTTDKPARFWVLYTDTEELAKKIGDVFFGARMGLELHPEAREYWPNVALNPDMVIVTESTGGPA